MDEKIKQKVEMAKQLLQEVCEMMGGYDDAEDSADAEADTKPVKSIAQLEVLSNKKASKE